MGFIDLNLNVTRFYSETPPSLWRCSYRLCVGISIIKNKLHGSHITKTSWMAKLSMNHPEVVGFHGKTCVEDV